MKKLIILFLACFNLQAQNVLLPTVIPPSQCEDEAQLIAHEIKLLNDDNSIAAVGYVDISTGYINTSDTLLICGYTNGFFLIADSLEALQRVAIRCKVGCCNSIVRWSAWVPPNVIMDNDGDGTPSNEDEDDNDPCVTPNYDVICPDSEQDCDGGSIPDCVEIENGTDPTNPDDDVTDVAIDTNDDLGNGGETGVLQTVDVTSNDTDSNCAPITYVVTSTINCTVTNNNDGTFDVTPDDGANWDFTYTATCDDGTTADTSDVSGRLESAVNITTVNDTNIEAPLDVYTQVDVTDNDSSNNCEPITYLVTNEVNCTVINNGNGIFAITPTNNGVWSFNYTATCSDGSTNDTATVDGTSFGAANNGACPTVEGSSTSPVKAVECGVASSAYASNFTSSVYSLNEGVCVGADPSNLSNGTIYTFWFGSIPNDNFLISIDWGDTSNVYAYDSSSGGNFTHAYTSVGSYTINIYSYCDGSLIGSLNVTVS